MSSILQKQIGLLPALVSLNQSFEVFLCYSGRVEVTAPTVRAIIRGWALLSTAADCTQVVLRFRRGNGLTGPIVGGGFFVSTTVPPLLTTTWVFAESLQHAEYADYSLTAQGNGTNAASTVVAASIEVELING